MPDLYLAVIIPSTLAPAQQRYLQRAVKSLEQQATPSTLQIYVVSVNAPLPQIKKKLQHVNFLQAPANSGFGELNNYAVEHISRQPKLPTWLLLLNDDAWVEKSFVAQLRSFSAKKSQLADVYVPITWEVDQPSEIDSYGVEYFRSGYAKNCRRQDLQTTLASAGCLVIRWQFVSSYIEKFSFFFNPVYFYYLEDVDLTLRMRMIGGRFVKSAKLNAYHSGSASSGGRKNTFALYHTYRNVLWVILCCWPLSAILRNSLNILLVQGWICLYGSWHCGWLTYPRILVATLIKLPTLLKYRQQILVARDRTIPFDSHLSPHSFRTFHNQTLPAL